MILGKVMGLLDMVELIKLFEDNRHEPAIISYEDVKSVLYQRREMQPASDLQRRILNTYRLTESFRQSYGEYLFAENPNRESIRSAVKAIKRYMHIDTVDVTEYKDMIIDILYSKFVLGFDMMEYFLYDFEHTPIRDRLEFLSNSKHSYYYSKLNDSKEHNHILDDKFLAYQLLAPYYNRDVLYIGGGGDDFEKFTEFVNKYPLFILKITGSYGGKGVFWMEYSKGSNLKKLYMELTEKYKEFLCEEPVVAPEYMKKMYPNAINTIRVLTYYNGTAEPVVLGALLRVGQGGAAVDNFSSGGIIAELDINTGVITSNGVDKLNNRYKAHPDTGTQFHGFQVERWDELLTLVKKLPPLLPQVRLIGWDIAASANNGWQLIEGNAHPWIEIHQFCHPQGFRRRVQEVTEWKKHGI